MCVRVCVHVHVHVHMHVHVHVCVFRYGRGNYYRADRWESLRRSEAQEIGQSILIVIQDS